MDLSRISKAVPAALALLVLTACAPAKAPPALKSFEFLGCSGGPSEETGEPNIWRVESERSVTFLVRKSEACAYDGATNAKATWTNGNLDLTYTLVTSTGQLAACECEYWAKFSFGKEVGGLRSVSFDGKVASLRGDWPKGR